ncbi:MAG: hypothetical protein WD066_08245 [Planctomycetaceae bacterium]
MSRTGRIPRSFFVLVVTATITVSATPAMAQLVQRQAPRRDPAVTYPPRLPGGETVVTDTSPEFLRRPASIKEGVAVAKTAPTVDFLYYPGQNYPGNPWSNWGEGLAADGKFYSSIGDHLAIGGRAAGDHGTGNAFVFEYDPATKSIRQVANVARTLNRPEGHYTPGKIHGRLDMGSDGWLYFATHRGSARATVDRYHYEGDWILRCDPRTGKTEIVAHAPVPKHCIPCTVLDPERMILYGSTAPGADAEAQGIRFFAYDVKNRKLLYSGPDGPARFMILARSNGRVYYVPGRDEGRLMRYDPSAGGAPVEIDASLGLRAATDETRDGLVYTVSLGQRAADADVWSFDVKTEQAKKIGTAAVGTQAYVASVSAEPQGRYLYYVPGAHGGSERDGSAIVQFDVKTGRKKVIAFLHPFYQEKYGCALKGTYGTAVSEEGDKLFITWNANRGSRAWDTCALTVIHIPESERQP